ncbi:MAG: 50S ribosomal protein L28 [Parcubacteria group bacterium]|nr:50S ribosomal protein L28 [Parcubacteria group bacterium]
MATTCAICGKGSLVAQGYSNKTRATKYNPTGKKRRQPNLQWAKKTDGSRIKICSRCLKANKQLEVKSK